MTRKIKKNARIQAASLLQTINLHAKKTIRQMTLSTLRMAFKMALRVEWVEHGKLPAMLPEGIYIANYSAWMDTLLLTAMLDGELKQSAPDYAVALNKRHAGHLWADFLAQIRPVFYYDPVRSDAECNKELAEAIANGRTIIMLPEGKPTATAGLTAICVPLAGLVGKSNPPIFPVYIDGTGHSTTSAASPRQQRKHYLPKVALHLFPETRLEIPSLLRGKARAEMAAGQLQDILANCAYEQYDKDRTFFAALLDTARKQGMGHEILEDERRNSMSYRHLISGAYVLGKALNKSFAKEEQFIGLMLPNVNAAVVTFAALQAYGKVPAMLNYTAGQENIIAAIRTAGVKTIVTARRFVRMADMGAVVDAIQASGTKVIYLEDVRKEVTLSQKLHGLRRALQGQRGYLNLHKKSTLSSDTPAVVLFTSGSEGKPKVVQLSHGNLLANIAQIKSRVDCGIADCMFNALPMFHSSGLTGGTLLPLLTGMKAFLYPTPLHYQSIPEMIADTGATILFAADTFLSGYARNARPYDLHRLRYVFAGAEKLQEQTRAIWAERFGVRVFEGYGVTETSPALALNTPLYPKAGTVGRFVPGVRYKLEPVEGIREGGRLFVQGANIMQGYLNHDSEGVVDGWYDTGDIASVDAAGYITILGRAKRFAKIAGEMVSLTAVENYAAAAWNGATCAAIALPDAKKGEQIVLICTEILATREALRIYYQSRDLPELYLPRTVLHLDTLPLLGSGKIDYPALQKQVEAELLAKLDMEEIYS